MNREHDDQGNIAVKTVYCYDVFVRSARLDAALLALSLTARNLGPIWKLALTQNSSVIREKIFNQILVEQFFLGTDLAVNASRSPNDWRLLAMMSPYIGTPPLVRFSRIVREHNLN